MDMKINKYESMSFIDTFQSKVHFLVLVNTVMTLLSA
jgi:hypothetical protein